MNFPVSFTTMYPGHWCPTCGFSMIRGTYEQQCGACMVVVHDDCCVQVVREDGRTILVCGSCEREYLFD